MNDSINIIIEMLKAMPNEGVGILTYFIALATLFLLHRFFAKEGLFLFIVLAVVIGNIQVLKAIKLAYFSYPIAMGTILFSTSTLAIDCLTEYYGQAAAKKALWLGFAGMLMMSLFMLLTLGTTVVDAEPNNPLYHYVTIDNAMKLLFTPAPAILLASLIAYLLSHYTDIAVFLWIKKLTAGRLLALRTFLSTFISSLVDNCLFNILAWKIFCPLPIDLKTFVFTYMIGTFVLRLLMNFLNTPFIYLIRLKPWKTFNEPALS